MTLTTARQHLLLNVRNGSDSSMYDDTSRDLVIQEIGARLVEQARVTRQVDSVTLAESDDTPDFSSLTGFLPEFVTAPGIRIVEDGTNYLSSDDLRGLRLVSLEVIAARRLISTSNDIPRLIAFTVEDGAVNAAQLWPPPKAAGSLEVNWCPPFTSFTAGTDTPDDVTLNIRDSILMEALRLGGPAYLQCNEKENAGPAAQSEAKLAAFIQSIRGKGGDGENCFVRMTDRDLAAGVV